MNQRLLGYTRRAARYSLLASTACLLASCSIGAPLYWSQVIESQVEVAVRPFDARSAGGGYDGEIDFGDVYAEYLTGAFQEGTVWAILVPDRKDVPPSAKYLVEGSIENIQPGNWQLRFWIGFGAGRAGFAAHTRMIEIATGQLVYESTLEVHSATYQFEENILRRCAARLAYIVADEMGRKIAPERWRPNRSIAAEGKQTADS